MALFLSHLIQAEKRSPTGGKKLRRLSQLGSVLDGHFQKEPRVEKGFDHRSRVFRPVPIMCRPEDLIFRSRSKKFLKFRAELRVVGGYGGQEGRHSSGLLLEWVYLERVIVETVHGILVSPVRRNLFQLSPEARKFPFEVREQLLFLYLSYFFTHMGLFRHFAPGPRPRHSTFGFGDFAQESHRAGGKGQFSQVRISEGHHRSTPKDLIITLFITSF